MLMRPMEFTDYMLLKLIALAVVAFFLGLLGFFKGKN